MGSLVYGSADASGLLYRRNRYYDPVAGQFTQEDPIGIAGGINLYGFANGDPVNFSDPFGLDPCMRVRDEALKEECRKSMEEQREREDQEGDRLARCVDATLFAAANVLGDAGTLLGLGFVVKAGVLAYGSGQVARTLAGQQLVRDLAPDAVKVSNSFVAAGLDTGARTLLVDAAESSVLGTGEAAAGFNVTLGDFVPVISSRNALQERRRACSR